MWDWTIKKAERWRTDAFELWCWRRPLRVPWTARRSNQSILKEMAPHSSTLAWKIPWTEEPGRLKTMGSWRVGQDWATSLSLFTFMHWRRKWKPTPVFLPGESQDGGAWWAAVYGVAQSWTRLKRLSSSSSSKGNQSWIFIGRTDAKAETPILWPRDVKNWLIWKDPDAGKDWQWEEKGTTEDETVGWHHRLNGHEFE